MKKAFKPAWLFVMVLIVCVSACAESATKETPIRFGDAEVSLTLNFPDTFKLNSPTARILSTSMFENIDNIWADDLKSTELKYDGKSFKGKFPLELAQEWVIIRIEDKETGMNYNLLTVLSQDSPTSIDMNFSLTEPQLTIISSNTEYNKIGWQDWYTLSSIASFVSNKAAYEKPFEWLPDSAYESWETAVAAYWDIMYPDRMKYIVEFSECGDLFEQSPAWVKNSSKWWFAAKYPMQYTMTAKEKNGLTLPEPPIEYYSFLSKIDFSDEFLNHFPYQPQKVILDKILNISAAGIKPIGETPVKEWQNGVRSALSKAFTPTDLLLDMLAAQSYINQIVEQGKPLTATQIDNIKKGFDSDLGKIILNKNGK